MPRDAVSRTAHVGTVGTNGLTEELTYARSDTELDYCILLFTAMCEFDCLSQLIKMYSRIDNQLQFTTN